MSEEGFMPFQDEVEKVRGFVNIGLTRVLVARTKLRRVFFKNGFLLPCTGNGRGYVSDIGVGKTAAHEWLLAGS